MKNFILVFIIPVIIGVFANQIIFAQSEKSFPITHPNRCGTMEHLAWLKQQDPGLQTRMDKIESDMQEWIKKAPPTTNSIITIPVVVHVVYANTTQSVSATCVQQQIAVLNKDYHKCFKLVTVYSRGDHIRNFSIVHLALRMV